MQKNELTIPESSDMKLSKFIEIFPPGDNLIKPTAQKISKYENILPDSILALWADYGFGNYGNGLIKIIDPELYADNLWGWLMAKKIKVEFQ